MSVEDESDPLVVRVRFVRTDPRWVSDKLVVAPRWVLTNMRHVDPGITLGVIQFFIQRSVKVLMPHYRTLIPDFLAELRTMINVIENDVKLKEDGRNHE